MPLLARRSPVPAILVALSTVALMLGLGAASPTGPFFDASHPATSAEHGDADGAPVIGERVSASHAILTPALLPGGAGQPDGTGQSGGTELRAGAAGLLALPAEPVQRPDRVKPRRPATHQPGYQLTGPVIDRSVDCSKLKCVALTFDDGPGPGTPQVLKALERAGAKATFFVLGQQVEAFPQTVKRAAAAGMEIGNHTWDHPQLSRTKDKAVKRQIERTQAAVKAASGVTPLYLRPPYGDLGKKQHGTVGMPLAFWDVDTLDWKTRNTHLTVRSAAAARPGDIVLMHDIHSSTVDAVPAIIKKLQRRGFHLVTLSTLIGERPPAQVGYGVALRKGTQR